MEQNTALTDEQRMELLFQRWFEINGQKVDKTDPSVPLLFMVDEKLTQFDEQLGKRLEQLESVNWQHFLLELDKRSQQLQADLEVLNGAKEQLLAHLDKTNRDNISEFAGETGVKIEQALFSGKLLGGVFIGMQMLTLIVFLFFAFAKG